MIFSRDNHKDPGSVPIFATGLDADVPQVATESFAVQFPELFRSK